MATSISSIGVGSGLPLDTLLSDLRKSENQSLELIKSRYEATQGRISAYATLRNAVDTLKTAGQTLAKDNILGALKAKVTGETFTAKADSSAIAGEYTIHVDTLATTQTLVSAGQASRTDAIGEGGVITFSFQNGKQTTLDLTGQSTSLEGIVAAINGDNSLGVRATLINDGSDTPHRLLLTSTETGTEAAVTHIQVDGNTDPGNALQALLDVDGSASGTAMQEQAATDATLRINGIQITSQNNQIDTAIEGITLNLLKAGDAETLSVARDDSEAISAVKGFVSAYNALQSTIGMLTRFDVESGQGSPLTGDSIARRAQSQIRDTLNVVNPSGDLRTLSQLGITTDVSTGQLQLDEDKLRSALTDNLPQVETLFTGEQGLVNRLNTAADAIIGNNGMIKFATEGAERSAALLDQQFIATQQRIDARMEAYRQQFIALDKTVAQMSSISSYLTQQLAMLSNLATQNKD